MWRTWTQVGEDVAALCAAYAALGVGQRDPVAIFASNSEHWAITDLAAQRRGAVEFDIPFSRQQLADFLAVERSGLSLELGKMKKEGLLDYHKEHFVLNI